VDRYFKVLKFLPTDFQPYGQRSRDEDWGPDCSCNCRWFSNIVDQPNDFGVCLNPKSPRRGLLTFEHQGCYDHEDREE
jgi:hypothetical protein